MKRTMEVRSREWRMLSDRPARSIEGDYRVEVDLDHDGRPWARIARGNDEVVPVEVDGIEEDA